MAKYTEGHNYTEQGEIIRGSRWPPFSGYVTVTIVLDGGWPAAADGWDWKMRFSRKLDGSTPDLAIDADTVTDDIPNDALILKFYATPAETGSLPGGRAVFHVDIWTSGGGEVGVHDMGQGYAQVRSMAGEG